jgi:integrase
MARRSNKPAARKRKGEGQYWQDKSGRHCYRITINGKRYDVADQDPERAKARFEDLKRSLQSKINVVGGRQSYRLFMERYLDNTIRNETRKASTFADYCKRAGLYILPTLGDFRLDALTTEIGQAWVNAMVEHGYAYNSIKQALALAKRSLDRAVAEHLIPYNPFAAIKPPVPRAQVKVAHLNDEDDEEEEDGIGKVMTAEQVEALLKAVKHDWLEPLYILAFLGARRGEVLGFRWKDYDREKKVLRVRQQVVAIDGRVSITPPKTRKSRRSLPLTDDHVEMLDRHHVAYLKRKLRAGPKWQEHDLIFCSRHGTPIEPTNLLRHFRRMLKTIGLEGQFRFHDLRHTANQNMKDLGVDVTVRAALLGHASLRINEEVYAHVAESAKRAAIEKVARKEM